MIDDPTDEKPEDWDQEETVVDPDAEKPEDWDEEDDGEWEAPLIDKPACSVGCGKWEPPLIANPDYKGKWIHPKIDNPLYKGEWAPKQIENPNYFEDPEPHRLHPMSGAGFEIWTMQNQIEFDNVFVDNSLEKAIEFGKATWAIKYAFEKAAQDKAEGGDSFINAINYMMAPVYQFTDWASHNPFYGVLAMSVIFGIFGFFIWGCVKLCCGSEEDTPQYGQG
jgi:calnexin